MNIRNITYNILLLFTLVMIFSFAPTYYFVLIYLLTWLMSIFCKLYTYPMENNSLDIASIMKETEHTLKNYPFFLIYPESMTFFIIVMTKYLIDLFINRKRNTFSEFIKNHTIDEN